MSFTKDIHVRVIILVINCGSSSVKFQLFSARAHARILLVKGVIERIGERNSQLVFFKNRKSSFTKKIACHNHAAAVSIILSSLTDKKNGAIKDLRSIGGVGHRVVHGGESFKTSTLITGRVLREIERYSELAPLHNPPSVLGIKACLRLLGHVAQVAVFDTAFHQTLPPHAYIYGLPYSLYARYGIRRYGFHGTSHRYVAQEASRILRKPLSALKLIICHLGNGCSMAAVDGGRSVDTSLGFTPLEGLIMGTRPGDLDPAIVPYLLKKKGYSLKMVDDLLNKKCGLLGISGVSNDMRDVLKASRSGVRRAQLAVEIFCYRIKKYIGAFTAAMGGLNAVILTAGIGEHSPWLVRRLSRELAGVFGVRIRFLVIPTNEEALIAKDTYSLVCRRIKRYR